MVLKINLKCSLGHQYTQTNFLCTKIKYFWDFYFFIVNLPCFESYVYVYYILCKQRYVTFERFYYLKFQHGVCHSMSHLNSYQKPQKPGDFHNFPSFCGQRSVFLSHFIASAAIIVSPSSYRGIEFKEIFFGWKT